MALKQEIQWREPYVSTSLNRKLSGVIPPGVYQGFVVTPAGGLVLHISPDTDNHPISIAVIERGGYNFSVSSIATDSFSVSSIISGEVYLCLDAEYIYGGGGYSNFVLLTFPEIQEYHIVIAKLDIPFGTVEITSDMIDQSVKSMGDYWKKTATTDNRGIVELATVAEAQEGIDTTRAVTPAGLSGRTATSDRSGVIQLATNTETIDGENSTKAVTPAGLSARTATETRTGVVELATAAEVQDGVDATRAVTPAVLSSRTATETRTGVVELATVTEVQAGTDTTRAITPAGLSARTASDSRAGIVELATLEEAKAGTDTTRAVTPAGLFNAVPAGTIIYTAATTVPNGYLKANGAAISRATYAGLFAVIGTTYGSGNGSTTFNLPDLRGEFLRALDDGRGLDGGRSIGSVQAGQNLSHNHGVNDPGHTHTYETGYSSQQDWIAANIANFGGGTPDDGLQLYLSSSSTTGISINSSGGSENRPRNVALLACIKY